MNQDTERGRSELVLVGGGHAHVQVLRSFAMDPPDQTHLTVVVDTPIAIYSGMVPGFVAGQYRVEELEIDIVPLARRAGARVILAPAVGINPERRRIALAGRPDIPYDVASFDIGSTVAGIELPGVRDHAIPTRPIGRFVRRVDEIVEGARAHDGKDPLRVVVVGGGAAGVELAFALQRRLMSVEASSLQVVLLDSALQILPGYPRSLVRRVHREAAKRGIEIRSGVTVVAAEPGAVRFTDGEHLPCNTLFWVTGAAGHTIFRDSGLPTDDRSFVLVRSTLQVDGHDDLFAAGDCATLLAHRRLAKAGVFAVREGPFLIANLRAALGGGALRPYRPQRDFLTLLNLGDGRALGSKWGMAFGGDWVMRLKDRIDRRFMERFQVLESDGRPKKTFPTMDGTMEVLCGGCAAKVGQTVLERVLSRLDRDYRDPTVLVGLDRPDDAAAFRTAKGDVLVSSIDAFSAFTDDPFIVGQVAAVNAASDLFAKGAQPRYAQALIALPEKEGLGETEEILFQVLSGARAALDSLGVTLLGGHTTTAGKLIVGFAVEGVVGTADSLRRLDRLQAGQRLVLTKPLGTGVLFHADMQGLARGAWVESALASMLRPNTAAARSAQDLGATAATDITGFGLAGHLGEMVRASGMSAVLDVTALPALPGAIELLGRGLRSTFHAENERARSGIVIAPEAVGHPKLELVFDPQTSGGLLLGIAEEQVEQALAELHGAGDEQAAIVGRVEKRRPDGALIEVVGAI